MDKDHKFDERLMQQVARGNRTHLGTLVRRYANPLLTFIQRMVGDRHRSEELFQEVFLAVWNGRRRYQYPRPFRAWLFGIAANKCRAAFRRPTPLPVVLDDPHCVLAVTSDPSPVEAAIASETATLVATAVAALPPGQRTVVVLRIWNGLSYHEIAEIVERTESTVRSQMFHALAGLRRFLEPRLR
ncbi:MAG: RNA polymerase sigma factor [Planctomycetota bacterium]|jgi:RNA polymerase sigma-70 factor (ECF subfamily)